MQIPLMHSKFNRISVADALGLYNFSIKDAVWLHKNFWFTILLFVILFHLVFLSFFLHTFVAAAENLVLTHENYSSSDRYGLLHETEQG